MRIFLKNTTILFCFLLFVSTSVNAQKKSRKMIQADQAFSVEQYNNERYKKPFFFYLSSDDESSGDTLFAKPGDKIYVEWEDYTLPKDAEGKIGGPYQKGDHLDIIDVATITRQDSRKYFYQYIHEMYFFDI